VNSGLRRAYVLTQFNSASLHRHIRRTYNFDPFSGGFVEILAAQQTLTSTDWYQGTADAVRQNLHYLHDPDLKYVLILSGDQLYRMDYRELIARHEATGADVTISAVPVASQEAASLGIMQLAQDGRVAGFREKPQTEEELAPVRTDPAWIDSQGIQSRGRDCLASTGIYLFNRDVLVELLEAKPDPDFGKQILPAAVNSHNVQVHLFDGYWEDIGTIGAFYEANLALTGPNPPFEIVSGRAPLYTRARFLPPTRIAGATIRHSLIAEGGEIEEGAVIEHSVIGVRCRIGRGAVIRNSVVMGNDFLDTPEQAAAQQELGNPPLGVGAEAVIERAIIDKNCRIGQGARIVNQREIETSEETDYGVIRDGIYVLPKHNVLPDGWSL
jgi:glucose-1-phosphate adenylyltransferase